jgi:hypothetical protein
VQKDRPTLLRQDDSGVTGLLSFLGDSKNLEQVISRLQENYDLKPENHCSRGLG